MDPSRRIAPIAQLPLFVLILACDPAGPPAPDVATIEVTPPMGTLSAIEDTLRLQAVAYDADGGEIPGAVFSWVSSPVDIVSVDVTTGLATARGGGMATVTASAGGAAGTAEIHVIQEVAAVEIAPAEWHPTWIGAQTRFTATGRDANGYVLPDVEVQWASLAPTIATVNTAGIATALSQGQTEISATHEELSGAAAVSVTDAGSGSTPDGLVYTVWFPRSYRSPALLVDGSLTIPAAIRSGRYDQVYDEYIESASDGKPPSPWLEANVAKFEWSGNRIGLLTDVVGGLGTARVLDRTGEWFEFGFGQVRDLQLRGSEILLLEAGGRLRSMSEAWGGTVNILEPSGVVEFKVASSGSVSWLREDGTVHVFDRSGTGRWTAYEGGGVRQFHVTGGPPTSEFSFRRVGILLESGEFRVRTGMVGDWQVIEPSGVVDSKMNEDRIALLKEDGTLLVKDHDDDSPDTPWTVVEYAPIKQFDLEGSRIAILTEDGIFRWKDDAIDAAWPPFGFGGVQQFELQDTLTALLTETGDLFIRTSINAPFERGSPESYPPSSVTQIRPLVHVPIPPRRMDPGEYQLSRTRCIADVGGVRCVPRSEFALPVPLYGRWCGAQLPEDVGGAESVGPLDPLDELCHHHDTPHSQEWYYGLDSVDDGPEAACIVRYGLYHSRLTRDGTLLTKGSDDSDTWEAGWGSAMPDLKDGIDNFFIYTSICTDSDLQAFTNRTRAPLYR